MATPSYARSLFSSAKRLKIAPPAKTSITQTRSVQQQRLPWHADKSPALDHYRDKDSEIADFDDYMRDSVREARGATLPLRDPNTLLPSSIQRELSALRLPRAVQATYLRPLKRTPQHGIPSADLQLRSYSIKNLQLFADFALRAAYYLHLPAKGPVPLPRITERWTVPRSNFVHKKSQENFERITMRRLIQIQDGHPETVSIWLGFLQKYAYHGVGMKANVWEYAGLEVGRDMDAAAQEIRGRLGEKMELFGRRADLVGEADVEGMIGSEPFKGAWGAYAPMGGSQGTPNADRRAVKHRVAG